MLNRSFLLLGVLILASLHTQAQAKSPEDYAHDVKDYALSPLNWDAEDWEWAAGSMATIAAAYSIDGRVRAHFADGAMTKSGDPHSIRDAAPTIALTLGTLAVGALNHDESERHVGYDMLEALALGTASSFALKTALGRVRPDTTTDHAQWTSGGDSFPSGHVTAAFAAAEVFAESRPDGEWAWRAFAYSLAAATAYARVDGNLHWTSDVLAGAALGIATGRFVSGRGSEARHPGLSFGVEPLEKGAVLSFRLDPNLYLSNSR